MHANMLFGYQSCYSISHASQTSARSTVDRLLKHTRDISTTRGINTTKPGALLKRQVPIRTFADWHEGTPGFMEADLVAHCGTANEGAFPYTLVLIDVATGWTECLALLHRSQHAVIGALDQVRTLLPFPLRGLDTDNGSVFLNAELLAYVNVSRSTLRADVRIAKMTSVLLNRRMV